MKIQLGVEGMHDTIQGLIIRAGACFLDSLCYTYPITHHAYSGTVLTLVATKTWCSSTVHTIHPMHAQPIGQFRTIIVCHLIDVWTYVAIIIKVQSILLLDEFWETDHCWVALVIFFHPAGYPCMMNSAGFAGRLAVETPAQHTTIAWLLGHPDAQTISGFYSGCHEHILCQA